MTAGRGVLREHSEVLYLTRVKVPTIARPPVGPGGEVEPVVGAHDGGSRVAGERATTRSLSQKVKCPRSHPPALNGFCIWGNIPQTSC